MKRLLIDPTNGVFLFWVSAFLYLMLPVLIFERMVIDTNMLTTSIFPVYRFLSLATCSLVLFAIVYVGKLRINALSLLMTGFIAIGLAKGLFPVVNMKHFFIHVSADFSVLAFYVAGTSSYLTEKKVISLFKVMAYVFLVVFASLILISYQAYEHSGLLAAENFHLSLNVAPLLVSFVYFLAKGHPVLNLVTLVLLFLSGKRSLFVTAILIYVIFFFLAGVKRGRVFNMVRRASPFLLIIVVSMIALSFFNSSLTVPAANRLTSLVYFGGEGADINVISSGRWNEFVAVYDSITLSMSDFLFGTGFGHSFTIQYESDIDHKIYDWEKLGFDSLPVHLMYRFGILGAIFISGMVCLFLFKKFYFMRTECEKRYSDSYKSFFILYLSTFALFVNSLFTYINPDPFLWFCFGLICSKMMKTILEPNRVCRT